MGTRGTILVVDDMVSNRMFLRGILKDDYEVIEAANGDMALQQVRSHRHQLAAMLLDLVMPGKDGMETLQELRKMGCLDEFPVLVVTSDTNAENEACVLEMGATDMIHKPYDPMVIKRRIANFIELFTVRKKVENRANDLARAVNTSSIGIISMLATVIEFKSLESGRHTLRLKSFTRILLGMVAKLCPEYGINQRDMELMSNAAILHDVGKVMVPDNILHKPGRLTPAEFEVMKFHTTAGCEILKKMRGMLEERFVRYACNICRYHHERWDGRGYPDGLKGDNIPLCAQVVSICDVYDALTTPRVYKEAFSHQKAVRMILNGECGAFNPRLLRCFQHVFEEFEACAQEYADKETSPQVDEIHMPELVPSIADTPSERIAAAKCQAMFRLVGGLILEVDLNTSSYNLLYDMEGDFELFRSGWKLNDLFTELLNTVVHPDDRVLATRHLLSLQKDFFETGARRTVQRYRVRNPNRDEYFWVEDNHLRIYTGNPNDRRAFCVWRKIPDPKGQGGIEHGLNPNDIKKLRRMPWTALRCRQDRWMTVVDGREELAQLLGYRSEELEKRCKWRLMELIVPEDQEQTRAALNREWDDKNHGTLEYRLRHKDGSVVWVLDRNRVLMEADGQEYVYRILLDNTKLHQKLEQTQLKLERQQLMLNNASEIFFEWDINRNEIYITDNFQNVFGYSVGWGGFDRYQAEHPRTIHPDDLPVLEDMIEKIRDGLCIVEREMRIMKVDQSYLWCRIRLVAQQWENGRTVSILGTITDINADKLVMENLKDQSRRDALTGLTNRAAASGLIEHYIQIQPQNRESMGALLILDIDNFKKVNDTYGHTAGDSVLIACGEMIRKQFRKQDVVARLGGDEFLIFLRDIASSRVAQLRCQKLVECFGRKVAEVVPDCGISCSVGVAIYPQDGRQFLDLQQNADKALLYAKSHGKNRYAMFSDIEEEQVVYESNRTEIESNHCTVLAHQGLINYTMHHLYRSGDTEKTIQKILSMVGRELSVSRVYIFENSRDNRSCSNTFEWCNEGVPSVREQQQNLSYEEKAGSWRSRFQHSDLCYCRDTAELSKEERALSDQFGEKSFLHCAIRENGTLRGFVGFGDCGVRRLWTRDQIAVLESFAELLSLFLMKKRARDDVNQWTENMLRILDRSQDGIYLVETDSYRLNFINETLRQQLPELQPGQLCYEKLMGRRSPCVNCPIQKLREGSTEPVELVSEPLGKRLRIQGAPLCRNGRDVTLLTCMECQTAPD